MSQWEKWGRLALEFSILALVIYFGARQEAHMPDEGQVSYIKAKWTRHGVEFEKMVPVHRGPGSDARVPAKEVCTEIRIANDVFDKDVAERGPLNDGK